MNLRKLIPLIFTAAAIFAAISCKKDDKSEALPSLDGALTFYAEQFIEANQTLKMTPKGISHPDGKGIGYYWKVTPGMTAYDTVRLENGLHPKTETESDGSFTYKFPDTLQTYTVNCYGFAYGYSTSYTSKYVTVVKGGLDGSITGTEIKASDPSIEFKGTRYYYKNHAGLDWFRNNLADPSAGTPYANAESVFLSLWVLWQESSSACSLSHGLP